ncbi:hypothetical protein [Corynebacterium rouxii]|uniref:Uncharacterized protein n=1 Tax=Corynebacterium rouxii TaxID=2719119 RepID=A0A6I8MIM0_9CORY|nr:hypothetical protein [Corynebacterium rouxii]VZH85929.1 hypothetical protein FRC0190_01861 [Corynebacterium rouxii]
MKTIEVTMTDGTKHTVALTLSDQLEYEKVARRRGYGAVAENPITAGGIMAWHALTRTGVYAGEFEQFAEEVANLGVEQGKVLHLVEPSTAP